LKGCIEAHRRHLRSGLEAALQAGLEQGRRNKTPQAARASRA
jgi:hypothetical protein